MRSGVIEDASMPRYVRKGDGTYYNIEGLKGGRAGGWGY